MLERCLELDIEEIENPVWERDIHPTDAHSDRERTITQTLKSMRPSNVTSMTTDRLVSRLTATKDLPKYKGDGVEWIRFKPAFNLLTGIGEFSEAENISRLYACLTGEAKEAGMRFGNHDIVLRKIIQELKDIPK